MLYSFEEQTPAVGRGTYVSPLARVIGNVSIGENCYIGHGAILRGDYGRIIIGNGTAVEEGVIIHAPPDDTHNIGNNVTIGHGAILHGKSIRDMAVIGMGAVLSIRSEIGEWAIIAEGGVVRMNQSIPPGVVAAGNPARVIRKLREKDRNLWNYGKQLYIELAARYLKRGLTPADRSGFQNP